MTVGADSPNGGARMTSTSAEVVPGDSDPPTYSSDEVADDLVAVLLPQLTRRTQTAALPIPMQSSGLLPFAYLDPEMLERVAAEMVSRQDNGGVQFYGRRGQKQHGLDIVERASDFSRSLYQVKRYVQLTPGELRAAVTDYAGKPRAAGHAEQPRRFDPRRFVVVTSAELDSDVHNVDELAKLQDEYLGDLEIEVWGAEALSRKLRDAPRLVNAVFGPQWAAAFCGFTPSPADPNAPNSLGLVEAPVAVLGLDSLEADAVAAEGVDPQRAAHLYGIVAQGLSEGSFPGHAAAMRRRQARFEAAGGDPDAAFATLFRLALDRVAAHEEFIFGPLRGEMEELAPQCSSANQAKLAALTCVAGWYEHGSDLDITVPALEQFHAMSDPDVTILCCLVIEQALVDGLYDDVPPLSIVAETNAHTADLLNRLRELASIVDTADVAIRARLRCAAVDASLTTDAPSSDVDAAYRQTVADALAGRFQHARGLVVSRAAYAYAVRGEVERADDLWRQSILVSSEDGYYGDARHAMRASRLLNADGGRMQATGLDVVTSALPNRRRLIAAAYDPALAALEAMNNDKLPDAFGDTRRYVWQSRIAGHLQEELIALSYLGDVVAASGQLLTGAVQTYVAAGQAKKAAELAIRLPELVDVHRWLHSPVRRRRAAAVQVIHAQAHVVPDQQVAALVDTLLGLAADLWTVPYVSPMPERDAVDAIAAFGVRIPDSVVDAILAIAGPALSSSTGASDAIANLLGQAYWALDHRRPLLADALAGMLRLADPPRNLWGLINGMPPEGRGPLVPAVAELAAQGKRDAIETAARWRIDSPAVQLAARQANAALLRRPVGIDRDRIEVTTQAHATVTLLLALLDAANVVDIPIDALTPDKARPAGGVIYYMMYGPVGASPADSANGGGPTDSTRIASSPAGASSDEPETRTATPDRVAEVAAGPPNELAEAVALHLMAMTEDAHDGAAPRAQTVAALRRLIDRVRPELAASLARRLAAVHDDPQLSEIDRLQLATDHPLSRARIDTGVADLAGVALVASAEAFQAAHAIDKSVTEWDRSFADQAVASAVGLLRSDDERARLHGAEAVAAISSAAAELAGYASGLLFHTDERVRTLGVEHAPASAQMFNALAADPAPMARAAVTARARELPDEARERLANDSNAAVRRSMARALRIDPAATSDRTADIESGDKSAEHTGGDADSDDAQTHGPERA